MLKKVTAQGPRERKSYTVTLPIEWVKEHSINRTREVDLNVAGSKVVIAVHKEQQERLLVNGEEYKDNFIKILQALYRSGLDEIKLSAVSPKMIEEAIAIIEQRLIGYEILEQKKDCIIIKDITKESEEDFKVVFRRIFLLLLELAESPEQSKNLDRNLKKLINYCQRILMKKGHIEFTKVPIYYLILDRLEKISDEYLWFHQLRSKTSLKEINLLLRNAYELFYRFDPKVYNEWQYRSYMLKNEYRLKVERSAIHLHNLARLMNSLLADIFTLRFS